MPREQSGLQKPSFAGAILSLQGQRSARQGADLATCTIQTSLRRKHPHTHTHAHTHTQTDTHTHTGIHRAATHPLVIND